MHVCALNKEKMKTHKRKDKDKVKIKGNPLKALKSDIYSNIIIYI
jgi:hypothetical protein